MIQRKLGLDSGMKMARLIDVMTYVHEIAEVELYDEKRRRGLHRSLSSSFITCPVTATETSVASDAPPQSLTKPHELKRRPRSTTQISMVRELSGPLDSSALPEANSKVVRSLAMWCWDQRFFPESVTMRDNIGGPLREDIGQVITAALSRPSACGEASPDGKADTDGAARLIVYSGHDYSVLSLLSSLGVAAYPGMEPLGFGTFALIRVYKDGTPITTPTRQAPTLACVRVRKPPARHNTGRLGGACQWPCADLYTHPSFHSSRTVAAVPSFCLAARRALSFQQACPRCMSVGSNSS